MPLINLTFAHGETLEEPAAASNSRSWNHRPPSLRFVKRHRAEDPKIQTEVSIALGYHVREGNERASTCAYKRGLTYAAPAGRGLDKLDQSESP